MPAGAARGTDRERGRGSGWARMDVNREDPAEMALAADFQWSARAQAAVSSWNKYTGHFNMFVAWYKALAKPRATLPASDATVA
jgi:hypothetical protein